MQNGRLPRGRLIELGSCLGIRHECDGCGGIIEKDQRMTVSMCAHDWSTFRLHEECFQIWDAERQQTIGEKGHLRI